VAEIFSSTELQQQKIDDGNHQLPFAAPLLLSDTSLICASEKASQYSILCH
jgi:hypothetical protein